MIDITLKAKGDTHIDYHHTTEDSGLALGECISKALGNRHGITRYAHSYIPMDETLSRVALDLSNRPYLIWHVNFTTPVLTSDQGDFNTELLKNGFKHLHNQVVQRYMLKIFTVKIITILLSLVIKHLLEV